MKSSAVRWIELKLFIVRFFQLEYFLSWSWIFAYLLKCIHLWSTENVLCTLVKCNLIYAINFCKYSFKYAFMKEFVVFRDSRFLRLWNNICCPCKIWCLINTFINQKPHIKMSVLISVWVSFTIVLTQTRKFQYIFQVRSGKS